VHLTDLQIAVVSENADHIQSLLMELDRKTELAQFRNAALHFGFTLLEHRGVGYAMRRELAPIFGYLDESGLRKLCKRYDVEGVSIGTFGHDVRMSAQEKLGVHPNDGKTVFLGWGGFLLAGARGENVNAQKVFAFLLSMERAGRIAGGAISVAKAKQDRLKDAERVVSIATKFYKLPEPFRKNVGKYLNDILDTTLDVDGQLRLFHEDTPSTSPGKVPAAD